MRKPETEDCVVLNMIASPPEKVLRDSQTILHLKNTQAPDLPPSKDGID